MRNFSLTAKGIGQTAHRITPLIAGVRLVVWSIGGSIDKGGGVMEKGYIKEASVLLDRIREAQDIFTYNKNDFIESEVRFRLDTLQNILIIASNDVRQMLKEWVAED